MARFKHVFDDDDEIKSLWIAGSLDWARQRNGTSSFRGPTFWRNGGGSAVRFSGPDGAIYCIRDRSYDLPDNWHHIPLYLTRDLANAGERLHRAADAASLETIRDSIDKEIDRLLQMVRTGQRFSGVQADRLHAVAALHGVRERLSLAYRLKWKPLMDQRAAMARANYTGRAARHIVEDKHNRWTATNRQRSLQVEDELNNPVDDPTSIREWIANERLFLNAAVRSGAQIYLRQRNGKVESSHGPVWKVVDFHKLSRHLIQALKEDTFFPERRLRGLSGVDHIDRDGASIRTFGQAYGRRLIATAQIAAMLDQTAPRLAASLAIARRIDEDREEAARAAVRHRAMGGGF